ncbi:hypothetical protein HRbin36_00908 [bacterium HR36]|nr:hypothetical protein HRbin36_00908 [bacterium HR36]
MSGLQAEFLRLRWDGWLALGRYQSPPGAGPARFGNLVRGLPLTPGLRRVLLVGTEVRCLPHSGGYKPAVQQKAGCIGAFSPP